MNFAIFFLLLITGGPVFLILFIIAGFTRGFEQAIDDAEKIIAAIVD